MIRNESAYQRAIERNIKANAAKTRRAKWHAANPDADRLVDWLHQSGEFRDRYSCGNPWDNEKGQCCENYDTQCYKFGPKPHPTTAGMFSGDFGNVLLSMREAIGEWGGLTDGQTTLVRRALARAEDRVANAARRREERIAADREGSRHVGVVGERREFMLTVNKVFSFDSQYGMFYVNLCKDATGNIIVYKGSNGYKEGDTLRIKATVKAHEDRDGVAQTLISRPKVL